jgi:putative aldouronate transport system substrate-binding protein
MKIKKVVSLCLVVLLLLSVLVGCTNDKQPVDSEPAPTKGSNDSAATDKETAPPDKTPSEPAKYTMMASFRPQHADFKDMEFLTELLKKVNVEIEWELVPDNAISEKKNLALSTGDMPDVFCNVLTDVDVQNNEKSLLPITEEMLAQAPNYTKMLNEVDGLKAYMTFDDGNIYSFPHWQEREYEGFYDNLYINKDWLKAVGLDEPNTIEEFEEILIAFKTKDPNGNGKPDEIPYSFIMNHNYFGFLTMYGVFGRIDNQDRLVYENGKVVFTADKEEWKAATKWYASLYEKGLLDEEGFTQDRSMLFAKGKADPPVIGATSAFLIDNVVGAERAVNSYEYVLPLQAADGSGKRIMRMNPYPISSRCRNVMTANLKDKDITPLIKLFDLSLEPENSLQIVFGKIGKQLLPSSKEGLLYEFAKAPDGMSQDDYRFKDACDSLPDFIPMDFYNKLGKAPDVERKNQYLEECRPYLTDKSSWMPPILHTVEEAKELATIQSTINDYVLQQQALWITGKSDIDKDWEAYKAQLKAMNLDRLIEIKQAAVDRYFK